MSTSPITLTAKVEVSFDKVTNAITGFVESGYTQWCDTFVPATDDKTRSVLRPLSERKMIWYDTGEFWSEGGSAVITYDGPDDDEGTYLQSKTIKVTDLGDALSTMALKAPYHFGNLINETDDAITHDVFVQMIVFGEIIYG